MKINSVCRNNKTEIVNSSTKMVETKSGELTIRQGQHYNGSEKLYEVILETHELWLIKQSILEELKPKSKLVRVAERMDILIIKPLVAALGLIKQLKDNG